jgi:transposase
MRTIGSPAELERRRFLAVERVSEGYAAVEVADFLGVDPSSVRRWVAAFHSHGAAGLETRTVPGRPPKLTTTQEKIALRWLADNPTDHGFATVIWTAPRLGSLIEEEFGVHFHPDYLITWLRRRGYTPRLPRRDPASAMSARSPAGCPETGHGSNGEPADRAHTWRRWTRAVCSWLRSGGAAGP